MKIWFTADTHFGHANIIKHCNRPYMTTNEMNKALLDNINSLVQPDDTLYHLGDFAWNRQEEFFRKQIDCKNIIFINGNHDDEEGVINAFGQNVYDLLNIKIDGQRLTLCHYAMRVWDQSHRGAWQLFGHTHGKLVPDDPDLQLDVGVDCWNYRPVSFDQIKNVMNFKINLMKKKLGIINQDQWVALSNK